MFIVLSFIAIIALVPGYELSPIAKRIGSWSIVPNPLLDCDAQICDATKTDDLFHSWGSLDILNDAIEKGRKTTRRLLSQYEEFGSFEDWFSEAFEGPGILVKIIEITNGQILQKVEALSSVLNISISSLELVGKGRFMLREGNQNLIKIQRSLHVFHTVLSASFRFAGHASLRQQKRLINDIKQILCELYIASPSSDNVQSVCSVKFKLNDYFQDFTRTKLVTYDLLRRLYRALGELCIVFSYSGTNCFD